MSKVVIANDESFAGIIEGADIAVVDFWATWCGPCKMFAPVFEDSADVNTDITHIKVDVDECGKLAQEFGIMSIPTTVFIRDGIVVGSIPGALNAGRFEDLIEQTRALNMDDVRDSLGQ